MTRDTWGRVQQALKQTISQNNFSLWIEPLGFEDLTDGVLTFRVPSSFMGDYVSRCYSDPILREVNAQGQFARRLAFVVESVANSSEPPRRAVAASTGTGPTIVSPQKPMVEPTPLDPKHTFDSFVVGKSNELANAAARRVAEGSDVPFNPLFLYGGVGLGKTHLMQAIAWELMTRDRKANVLYLSAENFMYRFVQAIRDRDTMAFKHLFRSVDVLMVDDIQFIAGKDSTQEEFFHTFNALVDQGKQIVLSADCAPGDMEGMEQRIVSRLQSGLCVDLHPTTYELRLGILQRKADEQRKIFPRVEIARGVFEFLAHKFTKNVRELEGALNRIFAHGSLMNQEIGLQVTEDILRDMLRGADQKATVDQIQRKVAEHYNIRLSDLTGTSRARIYARPRQVAMYLCKELTERSLQDIARRFGNRDHTTILYGVRKIGELEQSDRQMAEDLSLLRRALRGV